MKINPKKETVHIVIPQSGRPPNIGFTMWKHNVLNPMIKRQRRGGFPYLTANEALAILIVSITVSAFLTWLSVK